MTNPAKTSSAQIIFIGWLMVNIPVLIIMLFVTFVFYSTFGLAYPLSVIFGGVVGWSYWKWASTGWIKWAIRRNIETGRIHKMGVRSLILWKMDLERVEKIAMQLNQRT